MKIIENNFILASLRNLFLPLFIILFYFFFAFSEHLKNGRFNRIDLKTDGYGSIDRYESIAP